MLVNHHKLWRVFLQAILCSLATSDCVQFDEKMRQCFAERTNGKLLSARVVSCRLIFYFLYSAGVLCSSNLSRDQQQFIQ